MSDVALCPICNAKAKVKKNRDTDETVYNAIQDDEALKKVAQLKKALNKALVSKKYLKEELESLRA